MTRCRTGHQTQHKDHTQHSRLRKQTISPFQLCVSNHLVRIKTLRKVKGYTQEELAEKIDISANYLAGIERGEANPTLASLQRLSTGLEILSRDELPLLRRL